MEGLMSPKLLDPCSFLSNLVSKKGKSELLGVYLIGVNVLANSQEDYNYEVSPEEVEKEVERLFSQDSTDWNSLLVDIRRNKEELVFPISFIRGREPVTVYFVPEGHEMCAFAFIPSIVVSEFAAEVTFFQHLLREVAHFAGKTATTVRFTLGAVSMQWDDLVERGCAREVDVGF